MSGPDVRCSACPLDTSEKLPKEHTDFHVIKEGIDMRLTGCSQQVMQVEVCLVPNSALSLSLFVPASEGHQNMQLWEKSIKLSSCIKL